MNPNSSFVRTNAVFNVWQHGRFLVLAASLVLADSHGVGIASEPRGVSGPVLRVGVSPELPPMIFKQGKELVGVEADLARALGQQLGRSIQFIELPWPELIDNLLADRVDIIMSSVSVTPARQARVQFSKPYLRVSQMALIRTEDKYRNLNFGNGIVNQTLGARKATTSDFMLQQEYPRAKRKYFNNGDEAARALIKKKIDLFFSDSPLTWYLAGKYEAEGLTAAPMLFSEELLAWAMRPTDAELIAAVNKAVDEMKAKGQMSVILRRWIPKLQ